MTQFHLFQLFLLLVCVSAFHIEVEQQRNSDGDVITEIRKSLDGVEAGEQRFVWKEGQLPRLEDKAWWEKGAEWAANLLDEKERRRKREFDFRQIQMKRPQDIQREEEARFAERARMVMEMGLVNEVKTTTMMTTRQNIQNAAEIGKEEENEELLRVEITFFKNGTRLLDFYNGPLIVASPNGHFLVDYRNGTVKYLEGNEQAEIEVGTGRVKRYATLDDLYMAHGLEFGPRDAADFGRAEKIQQQMKTGQVSSFRADSSSSEEKSEQTAVEKWRWAEPNMQQNKEAYWGRPLYGAENGGDDFSGQMHGQPSGQQRQPAFGPFPPPPSKPSHQPSQMQQSASAATGNGPKPPASRPLAVGDLCQPTELRCADGRQCVPSSFQCDGTNDCQDGSDEIGCGSQAAKSEPGQQSSIAQPPSPSPSSWMQSRLQQTQPLSPEERELIRQFQSVQPPAAAGSSRVGNGVGMGNGGAGEIRPQQQQPNVAGGGGGNLLANSGTPTNKGGKPQQAANENANVPEWAVPK